ncbi:hypothetical protein K7X08_006507 [Anisodus acutangulus]|uniref:Uncharacterized protein n=1 Tax=Anisodus acutangulus TaxID=402998 RepID=A0A9Q1MYZ9_9SOLA|nr:hypothetical protein K7X08_006507 [Anisodus acutangulus]
MSPNVSASSSAINLLNFLPINFEVIDAYFSMLKSSKTPSSDSPKMDEVFMHEYILNSVLLKDNTNLIFTVANEVEKFYYGLLLLVTYLVDPLVQCIGWKKQTNLLTGFGTVAIEADSDICLSYEDAMDINESRKVNPVIQFLTVAFNLIESERNLMRLLKHKATLEPQILDLIESAHEELICLRAFLMDVLRQHIELNELHHLLMHAEVIAPRLAQISGSCYANFTSSTEKMRLLLSDLLQDIESVKVEVRKVCYQVMDASPCNMIDIGLINFLLNHQDGVLSYDTCSISFLKNQISVVKEKLAYLSALLSDIVHYRTVHQELKDLMKRVQDIKYVCFFPIMSYKPAWYVMSWVFIQKI